MRSFAVKLLRLYTLYFPLRIGKIPVIRLFSNLGIFKNVQLVGKFDQGVIGKFTVADWVQQLVYFFGTYIYEQKEVSQWKKLAQNSKVVLDIGSNFGFYSLIAANVNRDAHIYAFEPSPKMFERINENISLNGFSNVFPIQKGVSDMKGVFEFFVSEDNNTGMSSMVRRENSKSESLRIEVTDVDSFILENTLNSVDLVKIDVEGNEMKVLLGMQEVLHKFKPAIFVELYNETLSKFGNSVSEVYELLWSLNYQRVRISNDGALQIIDTPEESGLAIFLPKQ